MPIIQRLNELKAEIIGVPLLARRPLHAQGLAASFRYDQLRLLTILYGADRIRRIGWFEMLDDAKRRAR
jgi:hypothetical protein